MTDTDTAAAPAATIAVLGTGIMGAPVARNLARRGFAVRAWNRTRAKAEALAEAGVAVADTPADAVRGADIVLTVLNDGPRVLEAMTAAGPDLAPGTVWGQVSTVGVAALAPLAAFAERHGLVFYDAPVLGSRQPAEQAQLLVLASGPPAERGRIQPVFDAIGKRTIWLADTAGAGSRLKLALNHWIFALTHGVAESIAIARGLGVDPRHLVDAITGGPTDNLYFQAKSAAILAGDYTPSFSVENAAKDSRLIVEAAEDAGLEVDVAVAGLRRFRRAIEAGHGDMDMAATFLVSTRPDKA